MLEEPQVNEYPPCHLNEGVGGIAAGTPGVAHGVDRGPLQVCDTVERQRSPGTGRNLPVEVGDAS